MIRPEKICATCGRVIHWRKKWERNWEEIRYCGQKCRRRPTGEQDDKIEKKILELLNARSVQSTICPSDVARLLWPEEVRWREEMERVRQAARRLVARGEVVITQRGQVVDPSTARGPIRIRKLGQSPSSSRHG